MIVGDHSICDGLSLSTVAHELLIALSGDENSMLENKLNWPITMENAVRASRSTWRGFIMFSKFIVAIVRWRVSNGGMVARIPLTTVDFPLNEMHTHCYTEASYGSLDKEETRKLIEKCHREGVTMTSAISSAMLCVASTLINNNNNGDQATHLTQAIGADTRRRCIPPIPNHDLSYQVSGVLAFTMPARHVPTTTKGMWELAKIYGNHLKTSIDAGQILALATIMGKIYQKNLESFNIAELPTCGISNWGSLPFSEHYGKWELLKMTPLGNMSRLPMPMALVQTVNGVLTISYFAPVPVFPPSILEKLRDGTIHNLQQMIQD